MGDVVESDWKLFKKRLPEWQEAYMERIEREYVEILTGEGLASEKFWALDKRMKKDKRCSGVVVEDMRRSTMHDVIWNLVRDKVITLDDLDGFSESVTSYIEWCLQRSGRRG